MLSPINKCSTFVLFLLKELMSTNYDKQQWQAEGAVRDAALEKQRAKEKKARERSARNAKRKLERLSRKLLETDDLTDWEAEFSESVSGRLDKYGSAFQDREKGRPGDALSFAQKRVVASLNKKAKDNRKAAQGGEKDTPKTFKSRNSFKPKGKEGFTPRVRHLEEDMPDETDEVFIPEYRPAAKKPFLRIVKTG
jgi:hypothetical protein